jgi:predicted ribosome quality control (RQC) complex YloA/Tae2 family protein
VSDPPARDDAEPSDAFPPALAALTALVGARVDRAFFCEETGLLTLSVFDGGKRTLSLGVGPAVAGVGLGTRLPRARDPVARPIAAALRAHVEGHRIRSVALDDDRALWLSFGGEGGVSRLLAWPGRRGGARVYAADGRIIARASARPDHEPEARWNPSDPMDAHGDALVDASDRHGDARRATALARAVKSARVATERRASAVRGDLARLDDVARLQKVGRLLVAQASTIPRGAARAALEDWEEGGVLEVSLDPAKPARAQAEALFARARRLQRGESVMRARLAETEARLAALATLERTLADARPEDGPGWDALLARARALGARVNVDPEPRDGAPQSKHKESTRRPFHTFRDARGRRILVGRGAADNDALTTEVARPHDLWLHAKGWTGAHVVVPLDKGQACAAETLVDAATLAAHFSDARGESLCEVSYVPRRYVRKPRGSAPGAVTHDREKVLTLRVEPARLERLLASREE